MKSSWFESITGLQFLALLFLAVALFTTGLLYVNTFDQWRMSRWDEVPATITSSELSSSRSSRGGTSYRVEATYEYDYRGQRFTGQRVGIHSWGHDSLGNWQSTTATRLKRHFQQRLPHPCYVDPNHPSKSVLDRELRAPMMAMISIIAVAMGVIGLNLFVEISLLREPVESDPTRDNSRRTAGPQSLAASNQFESSPASIVRSLLPTSLYIFIVALPCILMLPATFQRGGTQIVFLSITPTLVLILLAVSLYALWRQWTEGTTIVELTTMPGVIGGPVTGIIRTKRDLRAGSATRVSLICEQTIRQHRPARGRRKSHPSQRVRRLWSDEQTIVADLKANHGDGSAIPFAFAAPWESLETSETPPQVRWMIKAKSIQGGPRFRMKCEVPVFRTKDSSESASGSEKPVSEFEQQLTSEQVLQSQGVRVKNRPSGQKRMTIRGRKNVWLLFILVTLMLGTDLGCYWIIQSGGSWILGGVLGFFGFLFTWRFLHTMAWGCRIHVAPPEAIIRSGATWFCGTHRPAISEFSKLQLRCGSSFGEHEFFEVYIGTASEAFSVGKGIPRRKDAEAYARAIWSEIVGTEPPEIGTWSFADRKREYQKKSRKRK